MRVRCGYGTGTVRGYSPWVRRAGTVYPPYLFSENVVLFPKCAVPTDRTHVPYPYRTRTHTVPVPKSTYLHTVPIPKSTYLRTVPYLTPLGMYTVPPRDAQIENLDFITLKS